MIQVIKDSLSSGSTLEFAQLVTQDIGYANYIEGGQLKTAAEFIEELIQRLPSPATCDFYGYDSGRLLVFTSGWSPPWEMTEFCYTECDPLDPPWQSTIAGFFFYDDGRGWTLQTVWLNDSSIWKDVYQVEFAPCP